MQYNQPGGSMSMFEVSIEKTDDKYKSVYVLAGSFGQAADKVALRYPDYKVTDVQLRGEYIQ
jgi:hypothetical protein